MLIDEVIYKHDNIAETLSVEMIEKHNEYPIIKYHLYCSNPLCQSRIQYIPRGVRSAHFRTWRNSLHSEKCMYYFEHEKSKPSTRVKKNQYGKVTASYISKVLSEVYGRFIETEEERVARQQQKLRNNRIMPIKDENNEQLHFMILPTTNPDYEDVIEGEQIKPIRRFYDPQYLKHEIINETIVFISTLHNISIHEETAIIELKGKDSSLINIYLDEVFLKTSDYPIREHILALKRVISLQSNIALSCMGELQTRNNQFGIAVFHSSNLKVNGKTLVAFIRQASFQQQSFVF